MTTTGKNRIMIYGPKTDSSRFIAPPGGDHPLGPMGSDTNKQVKDGRLPQF
jgi:hypothetical protein